MPDTKEERTHQCVELLQRSLERWSQYVIDASRLASRWNFDAGDWADAYARMWSGFAKDADEVMKSVSAERK